MNIVSYRLTPPDLQELATALQDVLQENFGHVSVSVVDCPDLRKAPFHLAAQGLSGNECIADIGGQPNLYPTPNLRARYDLLKIAEDMKIGEDTGMIIGAGAGPYFDIGVNSELAPNLSWNRGAENSEVVVDNLTRYTRVTDDGFASCQKSPTSNCALMMNIYGSKGHPGEVLKITARRNLGSKSFTDYIRFGLRDRYGSATPISIGGVFLIKKGVAKFHVMPGFPHKDELPFKNPKQLNDWLTYHNFEAPMICLTVMHTGDPGEEVGQKLGLRMEHTHCFSPSRTDQGGHYHHDIKRQDIDDVEYEAYLNTAKVLYRIDQPDAILERDLHDE